MSKSVGNVIDPAIVIEGGKNQKEEPAYGADVLRLWVSSVDYSTDVPISKNILKQLSDVYRKIRNTARFLLGNLHDFDPAQHAVPYEQLPELDRYMLHRMTEVFGEITEAFESFQFFRFFQTVQNFCVVDLSNFYLDIAKDRLYISAPDAFRRRSCQTVLAIALENLAKAIAPVLCHMAEDIWQYLPYTTPYQSVFEAGWVQLEDQWHQPELASTWKEIRRVRAEVNKVMEQARAEKAIGSSLEAKLLLYVPDAELQHKLEALHPNPQPEAIAQTQATSELPEPEPPELELEVKPELEPEPKTDNLNEGILSGSAPTPAAKPNASPTATRVERSVKAWQQMWVEILRPFAKLPSNLSQVVSEYRGLLVITLLLAIAVLPLSVGSAVVRAINEIPLLAPTFELIGFWVTWRFVNRYLLSAKSRQELVEQIQSLIAQVQNSSDSSQVIVTPPPAINQGEVSHQEQAVSNLPDPAPETDDHEHPTPLPPATVSNGVDELRYLFLASQVELLDSPETLQSAEYSSQSDGLGVGVVNAAGQKCDRCWNYSIHVGELAEHPLLCERCIPALAGEF
jgi:isoleucyl-tRNA synthetase